MRADRQPTIAAIRKYKPHRLVAVLRDGKEQEIGLSRRANRWEELAKLLDGIDWETVKVLDEKGVVQGVVETDEESDDEEEIDYVTIQVERLVKINMESVAVAMGETRRMFADTMKAQGDILVAMSTAMGTMQEAYTTALATQKTALLAAGVAGAEGDGDKTVEMMKMAMMLMQSKPQPAG